MTASLGKMADDAGRLACVVAQACELADSATADDNSTAAWKVASILRGAKLQADALQNLAHAWSISAPAATLPQGTASSADLGTLKDQAARVACLLAQASELADRAHDDGDNVAAWQLSALLSAVKLLADAVHELAGLIGGGVQP